MRYGTSLDICLYISYTKIINQENNFLKPKQVKLTLGLNKSFIFFFFPYICSIFYVLRAIKFNVIVLIFFSMPVFVLELYSWIWVYKTNNIVLSILMHSYWYSIDLPIIKFKKLEDKLILTIGLCSFILMLII